ncbi:Mif2p [Sugiyamaella lignohabitans]|uniref:Mif2p n=1 Tax=Sugiyamaella lignohabitans TaxID=796027 RepID=A0A167DPY8_9ASCO|nr:Mif2p [Sugiyamaella lignohabitans]ANB13153.1 Mif2p [Sugiyamaella lignohabitans]
MATDNGDNVPLKQLKRKSGVLGSLSSFVKNKRTSQKVNESQHESIRDITIPTQKDSSQISRQRPSELPRSTISNRIIPSQASQSVSMVLADESSEEIEDENDDKDEHFGLSSPEQERTVLSPRFGVNQPDFGSLDKVDEESDPIENSKDLYQFGNSREDVEEAEQEDDLESPTMPSKLNMNSARDPEPATFHDVHSSPHLEEAPFVDDYDDMSDQEQDGTKESETGRATEVFEEERSEEEHEEYDEHDEQSEVTITESSIKTKPVRPSQAYSFIDTDEEDDDEPDPEVEYSQYVPSQIYDDDDEDDDEETTFANDPVTPARETGLRRSARMKLAPLKFWKNERILFNYDREADAPKIKEVYYAPTPEVKKRKVRRKKKVEPAKPEVLENVTEHEQHPQPNPIEELGEAIEGQPFSVEIEVTDYVENVKSSRIVAWSEKGPSFTQLPQASYSFATLFDRDSAFAAGGFMSIAVDGMKPMKASKYNLYMFYVVSGAVEVTIAESVLRLGKGSAFEIPRGTRYSISNISKTEVKLFFFQGTDTLENHTRGTA